MKTDSKSEQILNLNQTSLQDFAECPRRFQLRWLEEKTWPAANTLPLEKAEKAIYLGTRFHQIAHQFFLGIPDEMIRSTITEPELLEMFDAFSEFSHEFLLEKHFSEQLLHLPFQNFRLIAKYDLIVQTEDKFTIIDWKTSPKKPPLSVMSGRVQSNLYPYIFSHSGKDIFSVQNINPDKIQFMYWYPLCSEPELILSCSKEKLDSYETELTDQLSKITEYQEIHEIFPLTTDQRQCAFCVYRSLCERGDTIGNLTDDFDLELDDFSEFILDIDQISELEF